MDARAIGCDEGAVRPGHALPVRLLAAFTVLYAVAHLPLLLIHGPFLDDWGFRDPAAGHTMIVEAGRQWVGVVLGLYWRVAPLLAPALDAPPLFAFLDHYLVWLLLLGANREGRFLPPEQAFWVALLSALAPFNFSRAIESTALYQTALLVFALATCCLIAGLARRRWPLRLASWPLLALACQVESFYFATALLAVPALWLRRAEIRSPVGAIGLLLRHGELMVIPVACFLTRNLFLPPHGAYAGYNEVTIPALLAAVPSAFLSALYAVYASLAAPAALLTSALGGGFSLAVALLVLMAAVTKLFRLPAPAAGGLATRGAVAAAFAALVFLLYPYAVSKVGLIRPLSNWSDRDLVTTPLALGLFLVGAVTLVVRAEARRMALAAMAGLMMVGTALGYLGLVRDTHLMAGLSERLRTDDAVRQGRNFVYDLDETPLWQGRQPRFYEWTNLMATVYGDETRLVLPLSMDEPVSATFARTGALAERGIYGFRQWHPGGPIQKIQMIAAGTVGLGQLARLSALRASGDPRYAAEAAALVHLVVTPYRDEMRN